MMVLAPDVDRVACVLHDPATDMLKTFINSTRSGEALAAYEYPLSQSESLSALARGTDLRLLTDIHAKLAPTTTHSAYILREGYQSSLTVPLWYQGEFLGFIFFDSRKRDAFPAEAQRDLVVYAGLVAMAIANERIAVRSIIGTIQIARDFAELRDPETAAHLERMSRFSRIVAQVVAAPAGRNDEFVEDVFLYAPLHDIGKIGIPDHVLLKPGRLDPAEWEIMKTHPMKGKAIIDRIAGELKIEHFSDDGVMGNIIEFHHEALDGSGYPHGLSGEQVPLESRIVAVADIFDALTSERPYKPAWTTAQAFDELRSLVRQGKLDASCVQALAEHGDEADTIRVRHGERPVDIAS